MTSRYSQLNQVELEAEEAALTAALEAVRGKVRTAEQERAAILALINKSADYAFADGKDEAYLELRGLCFAIEGGDHTPPPPSTILEGEV